MRFSEAARRRTAFAAAALVFVGVLTATASRSRAASAGPVTVRLSRPDVRFAGSTRALPGVTFDSLRRPGAAEAAAWPAGPRPATRSSG